MNNHDSETSGGHVLLFDRDPDSIELFKSVFDTTGLTVISVTDKESGIEELGSGAVKLVLAAVDFPRYPGFVLLQDSISDNRTIPVVILSPKQEDMLKAIRSGATDFFRKPLNRTEIIHRIPILLENAKKYQVSVPMGMTTDILSKLERENKEMNDLLRISSSLDVSIDSKMILKRLTDLAAESMNCEAASIMMKNDRENVLEFVVATGEKEERLETMSVPMGEGIAGWVALYGKPQIVNDTEKDERFTGKIDEESGFITRQILAVPMNLDNEIIGVLEVINTKDNRTLTSEDLRILIDITDRAAKVIGTIKKIESQHNFYIQTTNILVKAIEKKDMFADGHSWKVAELCHKIGSALSLSENDMNDLYYGALLHDIGKLEMPCTLLNKRNITDREKEYLKQHTIKGAKLLEPIIMWKSVVPCILYHHESWDGSGYPYGRSGESIPLLARVINLAESFTVMRSSNTYKRQMTLKEAILEVMRSSGKQFDPELVKVLIIVLEKDTFSKNM
ncbi:HD domain-containing protein [bacterium]|nr:HD domain-containing protein [bacterium]